MDKEVVDVALEKLKNAGVEKFFIRCQGGTRIIQHNLENSLIKFADECAYSLEVQDQFGRSVAGRFAVSAQPYDFIDSLNAENLTIEQAIKICQEFGMEEEQYTNIIKKHGARIVSPSPNGSTANIGEQYDEDGKVVIHPQIPARISSPKL